LLFWLSSRRDLLLSPLVLAFLSVIPSGNLLLDPRHAKTPTSA
jgi:hypothetical protein